MQRLITVLWATVATLALPIPSQEARTRELSKPTSVMLTGRAHVIDGDTIKMGGVRVRLEGIDAPELGQSCQKDREHNAHVWPAGKIAASALQRWVRGHVVACRAVGRDRYGRLLGRCAANGVDLNAAMVKNGFARAFVKYSHAFVDVERNARRIGQGIWSATCEPAWAYRANRWKVAERRAPSRCAIKGNISRNGRIYHLPWTQWYHRTRVDLSRRERWFCKERQALDAGWRPALLR